MANLHTVAREALPAMQASWHDYLIENGYDTNPDADLPADAYEHELRLYVYGNGRWIIDHAQYLTDHRDIVAMADLDHYGSRASLCQALRENADIY